MPSKSKVTLTSLKKYLKERSQEELIADIADLFTKLDPVKDYYQLKLSGGESEWQLVEKYKAVIYKQFFPTRGWMPDPKLAAARKVISDYKKLSPSPEGVGDLMIFYVETGIEFTNTYGDIDEPFYNSIENMYERALEHLSKHQSLELFEERCKKIVADTRKIGWGFHDTLSDLYRQYFKASCSS
jgi:hypothetical protein